MQPGGELAVEAGADDRKVAGAVAGRARPDVMEDVGVGVKELEAVVAPAADRGDVQHQRARGQVDVTEGVERVKVGRDERLIAGGGQGAVAAKLVDRCVAELVGDRDAGVLLLLSQVFDQRAAIHVGVGADLLRLGFGQRRRRRGRAKPDNRTATAAIDPNRQVIRQRVVRAMRVLSRQGWSIGGRPSNTAYLQVVKLTWVSILVG